MVVETIHDGRSSNIYHQADRSGGPVCGVTSGALTLASVDEDEVRACPLCEAGEDAIEAAGRGECPECGLTVVRERPDATSADYREEVLDHLLRGECDHYHLAQE